MAPITDRAFTVTQAASRIGVHPETLRRAIRAGELPATVDRLAPGRPALIAQSDLDAFVAARRSAYAKA